MRKRFAFAMVAFGSSAAACGSPSSAPPASTSTAAATTAQTVSATVPVVSCPTTYGIAAPAPTIHVVSVTVRVPTAQARALSAYVDSSNLTMLLGPKGWKCVGTYGADGSGGLAIYAPGEAVAAGAFNPGPLYPPKSDQAITVYETGGSATQAAATACPYFAVAQTQTKTNLGHGCQAAPPSQSVTHPSADVATFDDPPRVASEGDPTGGPYRAQGAVIFSPSPSLPAYLATCTVAARRQALCHTVLDYFTARYSGSRSGTPLAATSGGEYVVWPQGIVDGLAFGTATEGDILGAFGNPAEQYTGTFSAPGRPDYLALDYDCSATNAAVREFQTPNGQYCATSFFLNSVTKTFQAFLTTSTQFETALGSTVGMSAQEASGREGVAIQDGCRSDVGPIGNDEATLYLDLSAPGAGTVADIAMESKSNDIGLLFC